MLERQCFGMALLDGEKEMLKVEANPTPPVTVTSSVRFLAMPQAKQRLMQDKGSNPYDHPNGSLLRKGHLMI